MELNAEQIKKALEYCASKYCSEGGGCPLVDVGGHHDIYECTKELVKNAFTLINEQKHRMEKLERLCKLRERDCNDVTDELLRAEARIRELELVNVQEVRTVNGETFVTIKIKSEGN